MTIRSFQSHQPQLGQGVFVDDSAVVLGHVILGDDVSIWPQAVLRGDVNQIQVSARSNIQDGSVVHVNHVSDVDPDHASQVTIGCEVTVGHNVILHGCTLCDRCLIGMGSIVMDHVVIESDVLLAAGSLVTKGQRLLSGYLYMGSPAKQIRELTERERHFIPYSAEQYCLLKEQHRLA